MVYRVELQERDVFKFCRWESFLHIWPLVYLYESWCFHKAGVYVNKCAARVPLFACFTYPKSYCSSWNHTTAPSQTPTVVPDPPGFRCCSDSGGDAPLGKSHCQQLQISIPFLQLPLRDNTTSYLSLLGIHPLLSCAVHRIKKPPKTWIPTSAISADPVHLQQCNHGAKRRWQAELCVKQEPCGTLQRKICLHAARPGMPVHAPAAFPREAAFQGAVWEAGCPAPGFDKAVVEST